MNSKLFSIGDIVALKIHPYFSGLDNIIISGEHNMVPPLMIIVELLKMEKNIQGRDNLIESFKYKCLWFSSKSFRFIDAWIFESDLKRIEENRNNINAACIKRGDKIILKSASYELGKKKSSLSYEDNSISIGNGNSIVTSLLSFLPPVLQVLEIQKHVSKNPIVSKKKNKVIRQVPSWDIKCILYDPLSDKICETILPIEALELIEDVKRPVLELIHKSIIELSYLCIKSPNKISLGRVDIQF